MRTPSRLAAYALLILSSVTCTDGPTALNGRGGLVTLNLAPAFSLQAERAARDLSAFGLSVDNIHIHIDHPPATRLDTVIGIPPGADSVMLALAVVLNAPTEQLNVRIELRQGTTVLYSGIQVVTVSVGTTVNPPPTRIPLSYVGPGATLRNFSIAPHDTAILVSGRVHFRVTATDSAGAAANGVDIHWTVSNAALGTMNGASSVFTPAGIPGTTFVIATTPNGFRDSATVIVSDPPARLVLVSGGTQTGPAGSALALPVVVQAQAADGSPVAGVAVTFGGGSGGATANPPTATTGADGDAQTVVTLGRTAGAQTIVAALRGVDDLPIAATATAATAAVIVKVSGDAQADTVGATLLHPFVVRVTDAFGNVVDGATVTWARVAGSGTLATTSTTTDSAGLASVAYTLGQTVGTDTISATLGASGPAVEFVAAAARPAVALLTKAAGDAQTALVGAVLPIPLAVLVTDSAGKPIPGTPVEWTPSGAATVSAASSVSDSTGHASTVVTLGLTAGTYTITATLANHSSVSFLAFALPLAVGQLHFATQPSNVAPAAHISAGIQAELLHPGSRDTTGRGQRRR
jgi:Bacterial Ig-like domain (group 1)